MLFLSKNEDLNLGLTQWAKKKAFISESLIDRVFMLFECYGLIYRHFFE
jgi:hypothetical protein